MKKIRNKGITLIALVVTIIILIILAGVSISLVLGQDGVVQKAKAGRDNYAEAARVENEQLANVDAFSINIGDIEEPEPPITPVTGTITNMTDGEMNISATVALDGDIDISKTKYVFSTSSAPIGTNDETLYKDGVITQANETITKSKAAGTYYLHILATDIKGGKTEIISEQAATSQGKKEFNYTGNVQNYTLASGNYKLELWGAQGGSNGGKGGYAAGEISLNDTSTTFYTYVGGKGASYTGSDHVYAQGGWPNGGDGYTCTSSYYSGGGGGRSQFSIGSADNEKAVLIAGAGASGDVGCSYGYRRWRDRRRFLSWYANCWWYKCRILLWWKM